MKVRQFYEHLKSILGLALQLAKANFKLKNEGSLLGIFWYLLEPLLLFLIIISIRVMLGGKGIDNYPLYLLLGLIMFNFFSGTTLKSTNLILSRATFIKSMKINYESLIVSQVLESIFSHLFEVIVLMIFMVYFKISLAWILVYFVILGFYSLFILGMSFILSTIGVYVNDLNNVWRILMRLLFFATPLFYAVDKGTIIHNFNLFNPIYYFITVSRGIIIDNTIPYPWMVVAMIIVSILTFCLGIYVFEKYKHKFPEFV